MANVGVSDLDLRSDWNDVLEKDKWNQQAASDFQQNQSTYSFHSYLSEA